MADEYERKYLAGEGAVLHRQKAAVPRWVVGLVGGLPAAVALIATLGGVIAGSLGLLAALAIVGGSALYGVLMTLIMLVTGVSRVSVSEGALHVQMGVSHVRFGIDEIEEVSIGDAKQRNRGIGVRRHLDGTVVYSQFGDPSHAVRIQKRGEPKPTFIVCREPEALVAAVKEAQQRAAGPKVRVDVGNDIEEEAVVEVVSENDRDEAREASS